MKPGSTRDALLAVVHRRALQLATITAPRHTTNVKMDTMVSAFAANLVSILVVLLGETFERHWCEKIFGWRVVAHGLCALCHEEEITEHQLCAACIIEMENLDKEIMMDDPPQGMVS